MRFLCRHGFHRYKFVSMAYLRYVGIGPHGDHLYDVTERCRGCGLKRVRRRVPGPVRIRT